MSEIAEDLKLPTARLQFSIGKMEKIATRHGVNSVAKIAGRYSDPSNFEDETPETVFSTFVDEILRGLPLVRIKTMRRHHRLNVLATHCEHRVSTNLHN